VERGEIDVLVVSDGVLSLPGAMLAHNADPAVRAAWLEDMAGSSVIARWLPPAFWFSALDPYTWPPARR
jgi:hypothetical protein